MKEEGCFYFQADPAESAERVLRLGFQTAHPEDKVIAEISPCYGSNLFRLQLGGLDLIHCDKKLLRKGDFTGSFVMWPIPNRLRDKRFSWNGRDYTLGSVKRPRGGDDLIHGLVLDQPWTLETVESGKDFAKAVTAVEITPDSPHFPGFPFPSRLSLSYTLGSDALTIGYTVANLGTEKMPFGFGLHPSISTAGQDKSKILVCVPADEVMECDDRLLPTGRLVDVQGTEFDLRNPVPLSTLELDHVFTGLHPRQNGFIDFTERRLRIHFETSDDFTHLAVCTPPIEDPFVYFENQTCSTDALNLHGRGLKEAAHLILSEPGQISSGFIRYRWERY